MIIAFALAALLIVGGLVAAILPGLPGIPLIFAGILLAAYTDHYRHLGRWWLIGIAAIGTLGLAVDFIASALGARRAGASQQALWGTLAGTIVGLFFGLPGLLLGPFLGALLGELRAGNSVLRSAHVGVNAWIGLIFGTIFKLAASVMMIALFAAGWWWNRA